MSTRKQNGNTMSRSISIENQPKNNELDANDKIRLASVGLIVKNLFKEVIVRQLNGLYQLYKTAREIIDS